MRRFRITYRPDAVADLEELFRYLVRRGAAAPVARRFVGRVRDRCRRICEAPLGGSPRDDLAPGIRIAPFERRAVIAYLVTGDRVEIVNIFYGGRDYEAIYRAAAEPEVNSE
jgi:toxin ParE1/3/4